MTILQMNDPIPTGPLASHRERSPDRLYLLAPGMSKRACRMLANQTVAEARKLSPKQSGSAANGILPYFGDGFFGVKWAQPYLWYQERGINPFTMTSLAGKTIPMWIKDPTGSVRRENPKAETRIRADGVTEVKIFRKAARIGQRKRVPQRDATGRLIGWRNVPASYPGAPGRISHREVHAITNRSTGRIARLTSRAHQGVRWRHPGLVPRQFMQFALQQVGMMARLPDITVYSALGRR